MYLNYRDLHSDNSILQTECFDKISLIYCRYDMFLDIAQNKSQFFASDLNLS